MINKIILLSLGKTLKMKEIKISRGLTTVVDDSDYERLSKIKWSASPDKRTVYVIGHGRDDSGSRITIRMHREILNLKDSKIQVDHIDGNGLNNQKCNLRLCSPVENSRNSRGHRGSLSKYTGVTYSGRPNHKKWIAQIMIDRRNIHISMHNTEIEAAIARDRFVLDNNLQFYRLNILTM